MTRGEPMIQFDDIHVGDYITTDFYYEDDFRETREGFVISIDTDQQLKTLCAYYGGKDGDYIHQKGNTSGRYTVVTSIKTRETHPELYL